nr:transcription initiation factor tfiid subunit 7 [Quercus suber]
MSLKLKLGGPRPPSAQDGESTPATPAGPSPGNRIVKLKLGSSSLPLTPATEPGRGPGPALSKQSAARRSNTANEGTKKALLGKKRTANDDISPAAKRFQDGELPTRKPSLKIKPPTAARAGDSAPTPSTAGGSMKLKIKPTKQQSTIPKLRGLFSSKGRPVPKRKSGEGYDSEDSEVELDPAEQKAFVLRMKPGEDADYLRKAIEEGKVGDGADVSIRFVSGDYRRAVVRVRSKMYAAILVDLPCIVESMKSWDKKSWWKVSDICQMLLVLGPCKTDEEARGYALPREVNKATLQYAHGLTPPMHWVRKRRFRKRASYKTRANVEEEVQRLMEEDELIERAGGTVEIVDHDPTQVDIEDDEDAHYDDEADADGEPVETVEGEYGEYLDQDGEDDVDLEADLAAAFGEEEPAISHMITDSPLPMADQAASFAAVDASMAEDSIVDTPGATSTAGPSSDEDESDFDEDDDDDDDSLDVVDEDAQTRAAEKAQQLEEVADLEREIANVRVKAGNMTNQLLRQREMSKLKALEEDLRMKREVFGLVAED